jgi:Family of unknown function (DUF5677)
MLENEKRNVNLRSTNPDIFEATDAVLTLGWKMFESFASGPHPESRKYVDMTLLAILLEAVQRLYSIALLADKELVEDARILTRSLFELALAGHFVLDDGKSHQRDIPVPAGEDPREFRAVLYHTKRILKLHAALDDPTPELSSLAARLGQCLPADVIQRLNSQPKTYSGLTVKELAERHNSSLFHAKIYHMQSDQVHGIAGFGRLEMLENGQIRVDQSTRVEAAQLTVNIASAMLWALLKIMNETFQLGFDNELQELQVIAEGAFGQ